MVRITTVFLLLSATLCFSCRMSKNKVSGMTDPLGEPETVLSIIVDDLNKELGAYGSRMVQTPNVDRLARMGIQFDRAYCNYSVCNPSRSPLLTGLRPETTTVLNNTISIQSILGDRITLPALFKQNGYYTLNLGKIFHRPEAQQIDHKSWDEFRNFKATPTGKKGGRGNRTYSLPLDWQNRMIPILPPGSISIYIHWTKLNCPPYPIRGLNPWNMPFRLKIL